MIKAIILEDEPNVRRELSLFTPWDETGILFAGEGSNGKEGLALIGQIDPHIVITDIRMPQLDGLEMIAALQLSRERQTLPEFIILSGYTEFEYARKAMQMGVQEYLLKPVDEDELKAALLRAKKRAAEKRRFAGHENSGTARQAFFTEYELRGGQGSKYVSRAVKLIQDKYIQGVTIEEAADILGISAGHLSRIFRQETGYTFVDYLTYTRVKKAAALLQYTDSKIYEVADLVGYSDARYFSQIFRRVTGLTPKEFKEAASSSLPSPDPGPQS